MHLSAACRNVSRYNGAVPHQHVRTRNTRVPFRMACSASCCGGTLPGHALHAITIHRGPSPSQFGGSTQFLLT